MQLKKWFVCGLALIVSGCSCASHCRRPLLPVAATYPNEGCVQQCTNVPQLEWSCFFTDPALQQLISLALENSRDLRLALHRIDEARGLYGVQWAEQLPEVDITATMLRARIPGDFTHTKHPRIFSLYASALSLVAWELDLWGRLRSLKEAELENYLATEEAYKATYICLLRHVANAYLIECELNELLCVVQNTIANRRESYRIMKLRFEEGAAPKFEFLQAEALLLEAEADLAALQRRRELNWNALTLLVGTPVCPSQCQLTQVESHFLTELCPGLPSELLCNRPDIRSAEHKLLAAHANINAARAAFFPNITLTSSVGSASSELKHLFRGGSFFWTFIPNISLPIFELGKGVAYLGLTHARRCLALSEYERTIQVAFREVADALADHAWLKEEIAALQELLAAQTERTRIAWLRLQYTNAPYHEVLEAERDRFAAEQALVQAKRAFLLSGVNLYTALGGGYCR